MDNWVIPDTQEKRGQKNAHVKKGSTYGGKIRRETGKGEKKEYPNVKRKNCGASGGGRKVEGGAWGSMVKIKGAEDERSGKSRNHGITFRGGAKGKKKKKKKKKKKPEKKTDGSTSLTSGVECT